MSALAALSRWRPRPAKVIAAGLWVMVLGAGLAWGYAQGLSTQEMLARVYYYVANHPLAPLIFILVYGLRTFLFFPAMLLTIAAGSLFGFWYGALYAMIGENFSAHIAYLVARYFGTAPTDADVEAGKVLAPMRRRLHEQAFPTVLVLRVTYLPFDLINYGCGLLRVPWWPYLFGSLIGMLPPMFTFVSFGASIRFAQFLNGLDDFEPSDLIDTRQLLISLALLAVSAAIAWFAHRRRQRMQAG